MATASTEPRITLHPYDRRVQVIIDDPTRKKAIPTFP